MVCLAPGQDAECFERTGNVGAQVLLAVPRSTVDGHALVRNVKQGLVPVDHHGAVAKLLHPQPGVGGFACAAFGREQIRLPVYRHHGTVHQQDIVLHQQLRQLAVDRQRFQIGFCVLPHRRTFQLVCPRRTLPLVGNVGFCCRNNIFWGIVCPVVRAQRMYLRIDRFNFYGMPRQPVSIMHCALLIGYQVDQHAYYTRTAFRSQEYIEKMHNARMTF